MTALAYTRDQAAEALQVSLATLDRMLDDPATPLTRRKVGKRGVRIDAAEIEALVTGRKPRRGTARVVDLTERGAA